MTYTDPGTFTSSAVLTAAEMNVLGDDIRYLYAASVADAFNGVALLRTTSQAITTGSYQSISWSSATIDVTGYWTTGSAITVPAGAIPAGYTSAILEIGVQARFDANGTGTRQIQVTQNGSVVETAYSTSAISGETTTVALTCWCIAAASDALLVQVQQNSGVSLNVNYAQAHIKRIGVQ